MTVINNTKEDAELFKRYLLGALSEGERDELESRYFNDPTLLELLLVTENELIAAYTSGELSADEHRNFERNYLQTPEKRDRVNLVRKLHESEWGRAGELQTKRHDNQQSGDSWWQKLLTFLLPQNPTARLAVGFASLAIIFGGVWLAYQNQDLRTRIRQQAETEIALNKEKQELERQLADKGSQNEELARELREADTERRELEEQLSPQVAGTQEASPPVIPSFELGRDRVSGTEFGTATPRLPAVPLRIPASAKFMQLKVHTNRTGYQSYVLSLRDRSDKEVWRRKELMPRNVRSGQVINSLVPANLLKNGEYTLVLLGQKGTGATELIAEYPVSVARR